MFVIRSRTIREKFITVLPASKTWGTLAFEDLWPYTGDYDLNDLVISYRYTYVKNARNFTTGMYADFYVRAIGATFINGFGLQLPISADAVSFVKGQKLIAGYIKTNADGTEADQKSAVIIPFDDTRALYPSGGIINTLAGETYLTGDTAHIYIEFSAPLSPNELSADIYNPFIISNQRRGYEIHLPGNKPTALADQTLFGTYQDDSNTGRNRYYLSANNWPWGMNFAEDFDYPGEKNSITQAYPHFLSWAQSNGMQYADWYKDITGYRNSNYIYRH